MRPSWKSVKRAHGVENEPYVNVSDIRTENLFVISKQCVHVHVCVFVHVYAGIGAKYVSVYLCVYKVYECISVYECVSVYQCVH